MTLHRFVIATRDGGKPLLSFLKGRIPKMTPARLEVALHKGFIRVNEQIMPDNRLLLKHDVLTIDTGYFLLPRIFPENIPLHIVYEDESVLVVHKPAGMGCHAGLGTYRGTLLNALAHYYAGSRIEALENGLVHRLDKGSSGLMVVAKTQQAFHFLKKEMAQHRVLRSYFTATRLPMPMGSGSVDKPIGRNPENDMEIAARADGKAAVTHYRLWKTQGGIYIYHCRTEHGRTHQVRIHFASMGAPLLGDARYGGEPAERLFLCSCRLSFTHPVNGRLMDFQLEKPDFTVPAETAF